MLISLDLSAAFDTIDHTILLSQLQTSFGISGLVLAWFHSYLEGCSQFVRIGCSTSPVTLCTTGVPQGSVFDPILFSLFISPIAHIVSSYGLLQQQYTDDTQLYVTIYNDNCNTPFAKLELCLSTIHTRFCNNGLALNPHKSEATMFDTTQRSHSLPIMSTVNVSEPLSRFSIRSGLLAWPSTVDSHLMHTSRHFQNPVSITSRALCHIRPNLTLDCSKNIACSLIGCRLDYANSTLVGISAKNISRLQHLQSTLTRVVACQRGCISISKTLREFNWLPMKWRIDYDVATLMYNLLASGEPTYLRSCIRSKIFWRAVRSSADTGNSNHVHPVRKFDNAGTFVPHRQYGTACRMTLELHHLSLSFEADSKRTISSLPFNVLLWF